MNLNKLYINKRYNKIYKYLNKMCFTNAYSISPQYILSTKTKKLLPFSTDLSWKSDVFKEPDGSIRYNGAFSKQATYRYNFATKEWTENENPICWCGGLFEYKDNVFTGRYFNTCYLQRHHIINGWTPKPTISINCVEIEIAPDNWIMAVDINDIDLTYLSLSYDIQWKNCFCMKDICLEDVTPELEKKAFEEIENNK